MGWGRLWLVFAELCAACGDNKIPSANPPGPPVDPTIPSDIEAMLEHDELGRPILVSTKSMIAPDEKIALVHDKDLDDPITRWGSCLERVTSCYRANPGVPSIASAQPAKSPAVVVEAPRCC